MLILSCYQLSTVRKLRPGQESNLPSLGALFDKTMARVVSTSQVSS